MMDNMYVILYVMFTRLTCLVWWISLCMDTFTSDVPVPALMSQSSSMDTASWLDSMPP